MKKNKAFYILSISVRLGMALLFRGLIGLERVRKKGQLGLGLVCLYVWACRLLLCLQLRSIKNRIKNTGYTIKV